MTISQVFSYPVVILNEKAYVGGKQVTNTYGKVADFLYQNNNTKNVTIIEIKTPVTQLLSSAYRQTFSISSDLSGSVNQTLMYKNTLLKHYFSLIGEVESEQRYEVNNPRCLLVIGSLEEINNTSKKAAFENYRNDLRSIDIVTFDELFQKIRLLLNLLEQT